MLTLIKVKIQNFGRFLSNMIMPNISIFIAWGILTALFIPLGWCPNKNLEKLISPIIFYLLPLFVGYTGGHLISGKRGGLVGSITTIGVITSTNIPMLLGAMIVGPLGGWTIKYFDRQIENKIKNGFEMLVNNFSVSIIGILLAIISFFTIGPLIQFSSHILSSLIKILVYNNLLPLTSIIIEPAKIFFLIESNPGPGLGVLMAWFFFGKGEMQKSSGGAAIIEFLGGVHEIYFPYVLIKPKLIVSLILGGMTGIFMLVLLGGGLISAASPGSFLSILAMTPKNFYLVNTSVVFCSFFISFISSCILLRYNFKRFKNIFQSNTFKNNNDNLNSIVFKNIKTIIVACDAGMGSSAMGASILRKKIKNSNLMHIFVSNAAINALPKHADLIITHQNLTDRAKKYAPYSQHISLKNFLNNIFYDNLVKNLINHTISLKKNSNNSINCQDIKSIHNKHQENHLFQLSEKNIFLNQKASNKEEAIKIVGQNLVQQGYVNIDYIDSMLEREKIASTWLGESIALPHGTIESKDSVLKTGVIFCQFPEGVHFGEDIDDIAYIVIGIAAKNNEHIMVVSNITNALDKKDAINILSKTNSIKKVLSLLTMKKI